MEINCILIDDEPLAIDNLQNLLGIYCPEVKVLKTFTDPVQALKQIPEIEPDLIFLDINMGKLNGLELAEALMWSKSEVIFVTAFSQYSLRALRANALDYLLKPLEPQELVRVVNKYELKSQEPNAEEKKETVEAFKDFFESYGKEEFPKKIRVPSQNGFLLVNTDELVRIQADNSYCDLYLADGRKLTVSKGIGIFESILDQRWFKRVHQSHMVHLKFVEEFTLENGGVLRLKDGTEVMISRRRLKSFKESCSELFTGI
ncbi:response regulator transcription factor [bacterium SCSIO 12741]|nr:response regulator transcription factor [bacterium SCSIO 12741]